MGGAPPVVAVMVVHEPGPWFDEVLDSIARQDYPNLRLLFLVTGAQPGVMAHIGERLPGSLMRALGDNPGFGPAANQAMKLVEGAGFFCFLHDDVAMDPSTISELVAETYRSNGGIVGPKLVDWDRPNVLQHVGLSADRVGVTLDAAELGELDQEQHDAVRDVFCVPTACLLVRIDLFRALGGFARDIDFYGDDLDLCWRAHLSGARVLVVPDARARHRQRLPERRPDLDVLALSERHRLRTALSAPTGFHLVGLSGLPRPLHGDRSRGRAPHRSSEPGQGHARGLVLAARAPARALHPEAPLPEHPAGLRRRGGQPAGCARLGSAARVRAGSGRPTARAGQTACPSSAATSACSSAGEDARANVVVWVLALLVLVVGSRELILHGVPQTGELLAWPAGPFVLVREYLGGWWSQGLGGTRAVPTGMGLSAVLGLVTFGANGLPSHAAGRRTTVRRSLRAVAPRSRHRPQPSGRRRARRCTSPLRWPPTPSGTGSLSGIIVYGALPWTIHGLARLHAAAPFVSPADPVRGPAGSTWPMSCPRRAHRRRGCLRAGVPGHRDGRGRPRLSPAGSLVVGERAGSGRMVLGSVVAALDRPRAQPALGVRRPAVSGTELDRRSASLPVSAIHLGLHRAGGASTSGPTAWPPTGPRADDSPPRRAGRGPLVPSRMGRPGGRARRRRPEPRRGWSTGAPSRQPVVDPGVPGAVRRGPVHRGRAASWPASPTMCGARPSAGASPRRHRPRRPRWSASSRSCPRWSAAAGARRRRPERALGLLPAPPADARSRVPGSARRRTCRCRVGR